MTDGSPDPDPEGDDAGSAGGRRPVTIADVESAADRLQRVAHRTPVERSTTFAELSGAASVGLKLENLQRTGSFKIRGAYNRMSRLDDAEREAGVVTASAGNHAQGVALAGRELGIDAKIVVPAVTPAAKISATRGYGATVVVEGDIYEESYERALELAESEGRTFVHPFDDADVIAGQGTIGLELREQYPEVDAVVVAIGGGGLVGGVGTALKHHDPGVRVVGVQPEGAAHAGPSLERGEIHQLDEVDTVADGIADLRMLETSFAVAEGVVDAVVTVSDDDIAVALALLAERAKLVAETAGAAPLAALLSGAVDVDGEHVACLVSGGNVDLSDHGELVRAGLEHQGRRVHARLALDDWPGSLGTLADRVQAEGATLASVEREQRTAADHPNRRPVSVVLEGSGPDHLADVLEALDDADGLSVVERNPTSVGLGDSPGDG